MQGPMKAGILVSVVIFLFSCRSLSSEKTVVVDDAANKKTYELRIGQKVEIKLKENITTGFKWQDDTYDKTILQSVKEDHEATEPVRIGGGGTRTYVFVALKTGETTFKTVYRRSWEKGKKPAKTFSVKIIVK